MSRDLTIDPNWENWKFGDTDAVMTTTPLDDGQMPDFTDKTLTFKIASTINNDLQHPKDFTASAPGYVSNKNVLLKTEDVKQLTPGAYVLELWVFNNKSKLEGIYPSKGFESFTIEENTMSIVDISNVSSLTLNAFWNALVQKLMAIKQGPKGDPGITPKLGKVTVTMLAAGQSPTASLTSNAITPNTYDLAFQIPIGTKGDKGDPGVPGDPGGRGLPGKDGLTPQIDTKTGHWKLGNLDTGVIAKGATIKIGAVTTGKPGEEAAVTNSGDSHDAVLNIVIPKGDPGDNGFYHYTVDLTDVKYDRNKWYYVNSNSHQLGSLGGPSYFSLEVPLDVALVPYGSHGSGTNKGASARQTVLYVQNNWGVFDRKLIVIDDQTKWTTDSKRLLTFAVPSDGALNYAFYARGGLKINITSDVPGLVWTSHTDTLVEHGTTIPTLNNAPDPKALGLDDDHTFWALPISQLKQQLTPASTTPTSTHPATSSAASPHK